MLRVLVDDVRRFVNNRPCVVYRNSAGVLLGLREMAKAGTVVDELWLDHDLGGRDTIQTVHSSTNSTTLVVGWA